MKRCLYSNFIAITNYRNKNAFLVYYDDIKEAHQKYADAINVDYVLFEEAPPSQGIIMETNCQHQNLQALHTGMFDFSEWAPDGNFTIPPTYYVRKIFFWRRE